MPPRRSSAHRLLPHPNAPEGMKGATCSCGRWTMMFARDGFDEQRIVKHREHLAKETGQVLSYDTPDPADSATMLLAKAAELLGD